MGLRAQKFSGLGNEILIINLITEEEKFSPSKIKQIQDTNQVNFDQLLIIRPPSKPENDLWVDIYNRDGSEAENCVNGARCLANYLIRNDLVFKEEPKIETKGGIWKLGSHNNKEYSVNFDAPEYKSKTKTPSDQDTQGFFQIDIEGKTLDLGIVSLGNPHAICFITDIKNQPLAIWGEKLQLSAFFPEGVNLGLAEVLSDKRILLRVFERGVGETKACGSGACAAVLIGHHLGLIEEKTEVVFSGGNLNIEYHKKDGFLLARGEVEFIEELSLET